MITSFLTQTIYKLIYSKVTLILVLSISTMLYAETALAQLSCNPSCSNIKDGDYINESYRDGELNIDNVTLRGVANLSIASSQSTISFGHLVLHPNLKNLELNANNLTINVQTNANSVPRAIHLTNVAGNTIQTANISNSFISFRSTTRGIYDTVGIMAQSYNRGQTYNINLINTNMEITSESTNNGTYGIFTPSNIIAKSTIQLDKVSSINVINKQGAAYGIASTSTSANHSSIYNIYGSSLSSIMVTGSTESYGIQTFNGKFSDIGNKSDISVVATSTNSNAYGILTNTDETKITTEAEKITVKGGSGAYGISTSGSSNQKITNSAAMTVTSSNQAIGIQAKSTSATGNVAVSTFGGDITINGAGDTYGIYTASQGKSNINVTNKINASDKNGTGIYSETTTGDNRIDIYQGSSIIGGGTGIKMKSTSGSQVLNLWQGSQLFSSSDLALSSENTGGSTEINNHIKITGYADLTGNDVVFNNESDGMIDLKNFGQASEKNDITYNVGSSNGIFNNRGTIKFADENFNGTTTNAEFNLGDKGNFNNYGIIYLTGKNLEGNNNLVGDTLTINGNYVSNGGSIYLNTLLDDASSNNGHGTSDLIIVKGDVSTGSGATKLYIIPTASTANLGHFTTGDGIKVVDVQGKSSNDAFILGRSVVAGAYEYTLAQGKTDNSWYLVNEKGSNLYNPAMGAYLANQTAAVQMFQQTLFDRLISSPDGKNNDASKNLFWMRTKIAQGSYDSINGGLSNRNRSYSLQIGGDFNVWKLNNDGYFHLGAMGGYGYSKNSIKSNTTGTKIDGNLKGYSAGLYGTYFANKDSKLNLYVDLWSQMGWYNNDVSGEAQLSTQKYNSTVWSNSIELGYGIPLGVNGEYQWLATPQAQFTYNYYDVDNQQDKNNHLYVSNSHASGLDTRLGIRLHARGVQKELIEPFLEVNWLDTTAKNKIDVDGKSYKDGFSKDRIEANVGLQGNISERLSISTQMGMRLGNNSYNNYQGQLNLNYKL